MIIRTVQEIKDYYTNKKEDMLGEAEDVLTALNFEEAKEFLSKDYLLQINGQWIKKEDFIRTISEYMAFAWQKANDCRGLSANRSINHFLNWFWLIDDAFYRKLLNSYEDHYQCYGKPQLVLISEYLGIGWKELDNGEWVNDENQAEGCDIEKILEESKIVKTESQKFDDKIDVVLDFKKQLLQSKYSSMEPTDFKKKIAYCLKDAGSSFDHLVFNLIFKAQGTSENFKRLYLAFPEYVELWEEWQSFDDEDEFFKKYGV